MMPFTDEDMRRLKNDLATWYDWGEWTEYRAYYGAELLHRMKCLLGRLEAAEKVCETSEKRFQEWSRETYTALDDALKAWRKSKAAL